MRISGKLIRIAPMLATHWGWRSREVLGFLCDLELRCQDLGTDKLTVADVRELAVRDGLAIPDDFVDHLVDNELVIRRWKKLLIAGLIVAPTRMSTGIKTYVADAVGGNRIKIGRTTNVAIRIDALQTGCPHPIRLLVTLPGDLEYEMHMRFAAQRITGEWFDRDQVTAMLRACTAPLAYDAELRLALEGV